MFFKKSKEQDVFALLTAHADLLKSALDNLNMTVECYLVGNCDYHNHSKKIHDIEHDADFIESKIRALLFKGAFYSGIRTDLAELIIELDEIFGSAVIVGRKLCEENPDLSVFNEEMKILFVEMCQVTTRVAPSLRRSIESLTKDLDKTEEYCKEVRKYESQVDAYLHKLMKRLFELDIELALKLQLRDLLLYISYISDEAEDVTERIEIIAMGLNI